MGKSRTVITESLSLLAVPEPIRELADELGVRSKSCLLEVAKLGSTDEMEAAVRLSADQKLTRDDLRQQTRRKAPPAADPAASRGAKPHVFRFDAPDKSFNVSLSFRTDMVDKQDLIDALEQTLTELRRDDHRGGDTPL
jgi:hypothetical protein